MRTRKGRRTTIVSGAVAIVLATALGVYGQSNDGDRVDFSKATIMVPGGGTVPVKAAEMLRDDLEAQGPVRVSEVDNAQREILGIARRMADDGQIVLGGRGASEFL